MNEHIVIIGNGMATTRLVEHLVGYGHRQITIIGEEPYPAYNRILLSAVLEGIHSPSSLTLRDPQWYADAGVTVHLDTRVQQVHRDTREVELSNGDRIGYDRLVLATGSIPSLPPIRGLRSLDGTLNERVHAFRTLADCLRLDQAVPGAQRAVVLGGGLLGLQVARALSNRGLDTEIVEGGDHLLRSQVDAKAGTILAGDLRRLGTSIYTGARGIRFTERGLVLDNKYELDTDLLVITAGGRPSTALARAAGLEVDRGVLIDGQLTTSDPLIHAIGDCTQHAGVVTGFVSPAWEQAELLASHLSGRPVSYSGSRTVARLRATDLDVAVLGDPIRATGEVVEVTNPIRGTHRKLVINDGVIISATLVGDLSQVGAITQHYDRGTVLGAQEPVDLLMGHTITAASGFAGLPDETEVCTCAGVSAGRIRACRSLEDVRESTRATTGCGGCADVVRTLLSSRPSPVRGTN